ncbi:MAG: MFS transporter, partial [Candidatus Ranarchaeia archaeon]
MPKIFDKDLIDFVKLIRYSSVGFFFVSFLIPLIAYQNLQITGLEVGVVLSLQVIGATISTPIAGFLADRITNRPKLILLGGLGRSISYIMLFNSLIFSNYWIMAASTFVVGVGAGFFWTPFEALISDATRYEKRSEIFGVFNQQIGIGEFIGASIGFSILALSVTIGLPMPIAYSSLILFGAANIYAGYKVMYLAPKIRLIDIEPAKTNEKDIGSSQNKGKRRIAGVFVLLLGILFVEHMIGSLVGPFLELFLLKNITDNPLEIVLAYIPGAILSMVLAPRIGRAVDKLNPSYLLGVASLIGAITTWL